MPRPQDPDLLTAPLDSPLVVTRVIDQDAAFLRFVEERGLVPGNAVVIVGRDPSSDAVRVKAGSGKATSIGARAASKVLVRES